MEALELSQLKDKLNGIFTIVDSRVYTLYRDFLPQDCLVFDFCEQNKTLDTVKIILDQMLVKGLRRGDTVAAVGGGVTGDIVGFAASIYMRGIKWIFVPTTLLAVVDSSIGGKTGVNHQDKKNLIGAFNPPKNVLYCKDFLLTLPDSQLNNGICEIIKMAALNKAVFKKLTKHDICSNKVIISCQKYKKRITKRDLFDNKLRRVLNFGHTIGHAIELKYKLTHGEAVAIGMRYELKICGILDKKLNEFINQNTQIILKNIDISQIKPDVETILSDKKATDKAILALPKKIGKPIIVEIPPHKLKSALDGIQP